MRYMYLIHLEIYKRELIWYILYL